MKKLTICMFGMLLYTFWAPTILHAQTLRRLSAQFRRWDGGEDSTSATPISGGGGTNIYTKTVTVPPNSNVLFITYATTGDVHFGTFSNTMLHLCLVDGLPCNPGFNFSSGGFTGWIATQKPCDNSGCGSNPNLGDRHDNSVMYEWCANIPLVSFATVHTVAINLASADPAGSVFNEASHIFIDTTRIGGGCSKSTTPAAPTTKQTTH